MTIKDIKNFKKRLLKEEGRTLKWFRQKYLPQVEYNYFIFQINGHRKGGIDSSITNAIKTYMED